VHATRGFFAALRMTKSSFNLAEIRQIPVNPICRRKAG
jgi:hypothetical protein